MGTYIDLCKSKICTFSSYILKPFYCFNRISSEGGNEMRNSIEVKKEELKISVLEQEIVLQGLQINLK